MGHLESKESATVRHLSEPVTQHMSRSPAMSHDFPHLPSSCREHGGDIPVADAFDADF